MVNIAKYCYKYSIQFRTWHEMSTRAGFIFGAACCDVLHSSMDAKNREESGESVSCLEVCSV